MGHVGVHELGLGLGQRNGQRRSSARLLAIRQRLQNVRRRRAALAALNVAGLGRGGLGQLIPTRSDAARWGLPAQSIAEGFPYRFPFAAQSAYIDREAQIVGGHGGVYAADLAAGIPARIQQLLPHFYQAPTPQQMGVTPWTNPWSHQQYWGGVGPSGAFPVFGSPGYATQGFYPPQGPGGFVAPVANAQGQFPIPGTAREQF